MSDDQDTTNNTHHHQYQDNDAGVSQFLAITGSTDMAQATSFLDMSGGSLDTAIALFFEHRGSGVSGSAGMPPLPHHDTDDSVRAPDATRSMRLMDHDHHAHDGFHAPFASSAAASLASFVAANEQQQQQQEALLLASSAFEASSSNSVLVRHVVNQHAAAAAAASLVQRHDTHGDDDDDYVYMQDDSDDNDDDGEDSNNNNNNNNVSSTTDTQNNNLLQHMFAPPTHLLHTAGGFQGARAVAKDSRRWLLVNIQRNEEFSSHALNRDVWRDELVENLVREGFIFWQTMDVTPDGRTYVERYQVRHFPHVAILDPRTGRLVWRKEGWTQQHALTAMDFAEYAMDFCSKHSFDKPPFVGTLSKNNNNNNNNNMNGTSGGGGTNGGTKRPMTEQEQLQEAVRASLKPTDSSSSSNGDGDDDVDDDHHVEYLGTTTTTTTSNEPLTAASMSFEPATTTKPSGTASSSTTTTTRPTNEFLIMAVGEEPDDGARIQFRMPDAKRLVRKFASDRPVKILYAFVAQSNEEAQGGREFCLKAGYPPKDLAGSMDDTIGSCKLSGQAVTVRWKES